MTGKQTQGAVAYDGTGALKMAAPEAPAQKKKFRKSIKSMIFSHFSYYGKHDKK